MKKRLLAYMLPLLFVFSAAFAGNVPPVFSAGGSVIIPGEKGFGILVKWRGVCTAVMPKHVVDDIRQSHAGLKNLPAIAIQIDDGSRSLLTDNSWKLEASDLYVSIFQSRVPKACRDAPELKVLRDTLIALAETPRDRGVPVNFFIDSFGRSSSLQAKHLNELFRVKDTEYLQYRLRKCSALESSTQGCTPPIVGYSGIPIWMSGLNGEPIFVALHRETCNDPMKCQSDGEAFWSGITVIQIFKFYDVLNENGVFGHQSQTAIEPGSELPEDGTNTLRTAQQELARLKCDPGLVDGRWGSRSVRAYERFRRAYKPEVGNDKLPTSDIVRTMSQLAPKACPDLCGAGESYTNGICTTGKKKSNTRKPVVSSRKNRSNNASTGGTVCFTFTTPTGVEHACKVQ